MTVSWSDLFGDAPVVLDGGLSTQLESRGHDVSGALWTGRVLLEDPAAVSAAHADYVRAGAGVVMHERRAWRGKGRRNHRIQYARAHQGGRSWGGRSC